MSRSKLCYLKASGTQLQEQETKLSTVKLDFIIYPLKIAFCLKEQVIEIYIVNSPNDEYF